MRKTGRPKLAGAAQVEGGNPKEGYGPPKTAQANGRFGVEFPVGSCREALGLLAIARGVVGPGEIRHNGGPGLRIIFHVQAQRVRLVGVYARLVLVGKRPL